MEITKEVKTKLVLTLSTEDAGDIIAALQETQQRMTQLDTEKMMMPTILKRLEDTLNQTLK